MSTLDEEIAKLFCKTCVVNTSYCKMGERKKGFMCLQVLNFLVDVKRTCAKHFLDEIEKRKTGGYLREKWGRIEFVKLDDIRKIFNRYIKGEK